MRIADPTHTHRERERGLTGGSIKIKTTAKKLVPSFTVTPMRARSRLAEMARIVSFDTHVLFRHSGTTRFSSIVKWSSLRHGDDGDHNTEGEQRQQRSRTAKSHSAFILNHERSQGTRQYDSRSKVVTQNQRWRICPRLMSEQPACLAKPRGGRALRPCWWRRTKMS